MLAGDGHGFQPGEVEPLSRGLKGKVDDPEMVLKAVLDWTGGQPFLTQKVCQLIFTASEPIPIGGEAQWVENLVQKHIIENWEAQDDPEHLKTIRDRLFFNQKSVSRLLGLYQQILQQEGVAADGTPQQMELRLSGLVVRHQGQLRAANRIYQSVFNRNWVEQELGKLRPYSEMEFKFR